MLKRKYSIEITSVNTKNPKIQRAIWNLLTEIDQEFVPPLSFRDSTIAMKFSGEHTQETKGPRAYFEEILTQKIALAKVQKKWAGFLSFRYITDLEVLANYLPCNYLTTIGVIPDFRNIGVARSLYRYVLHDLPHELQAPYWATRTWSTNEDHLHLLRSLGFSLAAKIENHRGPGLDTLYYAYKLPNFTLPASTEPA